MHSIRYRSIVGRLYISSGILFSLIFIFGAIILDDWTLWLYPIVSGFLIYVGYQALKNPYIQYSKNEIIFFHVFNLESKRYSLLEKDIIKIDEVNIYLNGKKLKANSWFVNKGEWERFKRFYASSEDNFISELQDSSR